MPIEQFKKHLKTSSPESAQPVEVHVTLGPVAHLGKLLLQCDVSNGQNTIGLFQIALGPLQLCAQAFPKISAGPTQHEQRRDIYRSIPAELVSGRHLKPHLVGGTVSARISHLLASSTHAGTRKDQDAAQRY